MCCSNLCQVVLLQAAHTFCVSVLYVHVVFDDKHVLNRARVYVFTPDQANFYMYIYFHGWYECTCTQHTVAHCILS